MSSRTSPGGNAGGASRRSSDGRAAAVPPSHRPSARAVALDAARHALPLLPLYLRRGSIPIYLALTAFDLALGLVLIVGTTRDRSDPTTVDPRATWLISRATAVVVLAVFLALVSAVIAVPIAAPAFVFGWVTDVDWWTVVVDRGFWVPVAAMSLVTGLRAQHRFEAATTPGERDTSAYAAPIVGDIDEDRRRSSVAYAAQVTLIATYAGLSYALGVFGRTGFTVLPILYAALLVLYDARPDLAHGILPDLWRGTR